MGYDRLALTDTDTLYGLMPFIEACGEHGVRPIVGAELTDPSTGHRAILLVQSAEGYKTLCHLITARHLDKDFRLSQAVAKSHEGVSLLTGNLSLLREWREKNVTLHAALPRKPISRSAPLMETAKALQIPLAATPGSFYLHESDAPVHHMLRAIDLKTTLDRVGALDKAPEGSFLAPEKVYIDRFSACPEAIRNTRALAETLEFDGPRFGLVMPPWNDKEGQETGHCLREAAYQGAFSRYGRDLPENLVNRLEHELAIIGQMGFSSYFLTVKDIVSLSPRICGRGSGAASLVAYCLKITNVCPVKHNLYFERFLNPGRKDPPDIDVDFAWDERDAVIAQVFERHPDHAAMVSNHVCIKPRMAVRDVARVFGLPEAEISRVTKKIPWFIDGDDEGRTILKALAQGSGSKGSTLPSPWPDILGFAQKIVGLPRCLSVHPGGIVITPRPIADYVPVEKAPKGVKIIQWDKDQAEAAGLVKIDLLGNRSLGVIRDAISNLKINGHRLDEASWEPEADFETQEMVAQGRTMGCFYIESPAMRLLQKKSGTGDFEHLVIHSSIIRPAANECIQAYLKRLHGEPWEPLHPLIAGILDETYGILTYQEDVSKTAVALAGFSHAHADGLRKVMSKKEKNRALKDFYQDFETGARRNGVPPSVISEVWQMMLSFSGYSFCKPHSASYAKVSFQAAWLKTHFPAEFMAAVISNQGGFYSAFAYVSEAMRLGLAILPPDVNQSEIRWRGNGKNLRAGLLSIRELSRAAMGRILAERKKRCFKSMEDFLTRARPDLPEAEAMIRCGALDSLNPNMSRSAMMWRLAYFNKNRPRADERILPIPIAPLALPVPPPILDDPLKRVQQEFETLGFICDRHLLLYYQSLLEKHRVVKAIHLGRYVGKRILMAGFLVTGKTVSTKHGDPMEFLTFEDETAIFETTLFPQVYARYRHLMESQRPYLLRGSVDANWGAATLTVSHITPLPAFTSL